jgi:hypothetical protein
MDMKTQQAMDLEATARNRALWEEVRRAQRKLLRVTAQIELPNGKSLPGHTVDISQEGVGFCSPFAVEVDQSCTLILALDACGSQSLLTLTGHIRHCTRQPDQTSFRIGMQFSGLDGRAREILGAALR